MVNFALFPISFKLLVVIKTWRQAKSGLPSYFLNKKTKTQNINEEIEKTYEENEQRYPENDVEHF